jgi:biopolymer transport protein ExbB
VTFDLAHIWDSMSIANKAITIFIALMGLLTAAIGFERVVALGKSARVSREFAAKVEPALAAWDLEGILAIARAHQASNLARLFEALTLKYAQVTAREVGGMSPIDAVRNESARKLEVLGAELKRGMPVLATIGSITPFVGLLGTVIGIIAAFSAIGAAGAGGIGTVSAGISEALIETAFGLAVAIPAVMVFNYLTSRISTVEAALARSAGQLIDEMEYRHVSPPERDSDLIETRVAA